MESVTRIKEQLPSRFTNLYLYFKGITFLRSFIYLNRQVTQRIEHSICFSTELPELFIVGVGERMSKSKEITLLLSSKYYLEEPQLCIIHASTCLGESSLWPRGSSKQEIFTSNTAKVEYLKTGSSCTSSKEAGLGQVQASEDSTGRLFDSL